MFQNSTPIWVLRSRTNASKFLVCSQVTEKGSFHQGTRKSEPQNFPYIIISEYIERVIHQGTSLHEDLKLPDLSRISSVSGRVISSGHEEKPCSGKFLASYTLGHEA